MKLVREVLQETGITATCGIGTNLYLAKIAMDIQAKKMKPDKDGVRIASLDELTYRRELWEHRPLTDFWRVGHGYYVTGNHEYWSGADAFVRKMAILDRYGIARLSGTASELEIRGVRLMIGGVDDPCQWTGSLNGTVPDGFLSELSDVSELSKGCDVSILLSHRPELFDLYCRHGFDLVLAGHAHGGQWRIPGLLNGLYAPNQGFFPPLAGGKYERDGTVMIVSRGLARESTRIPRYYNPPELVMIDLK